MGSSTTGQISRAEGDPFEVDQRRQLLRRSSLAKVAARCHLATYLSDRYSACRRRYSPEAKGYGLCLLWPDDDVKYNDKSPETEPVHFSQPVLDGIKYYLQH
jgi:hypothetical protein